MSDSLQPHELQHTKLPCLSLAPRVCSNSCLLSRWHQPTISSSVSFFSSCPQYFLASGAFPVSQFFHIRWPNIETSASASLISINIQGWFPSGLTDLISVLSKVLSRVFSSTTVQKQQFFGVGEDSWEYFRLQGDQTSSPEGNQSWIFIGRIDAEAEAEAPVLCPPDVKNWLIGKDPDAGKDWRQDENRTTKNEVVGLHHSMDTSLSELWDFVMDREARHAAVHGIAKSWTWLSNWTKCMTSYLRTIYCLFLEHI